MLIKKDTLLQKIIPWGVLILILLLIFIFFYFINEGFNDTYLELYKKNFIVIIGLPLGVLLALFIVLFLEQTQGPIEFKGLGFEFKGASGPVVLWVLCYLVIVISFKLLWTTEFE